MNMLLLYLQYPFVRNALIVGVLIALCSSLLGVPLVLRRFSLIGDGLSHVAFGAMSVASVLHLTNKMLITLPVTILSAVILLKNGRKARIRGDAAVALISVSALAFGYIIVNLFSNSANLSGDVCSTLFGSTSILTLTGREVIMSAILSIAVVVLYILFYNEIFSVTFDEDFARSAGIAVDRVNFLSAVVVAVVIVLAMNLVGSLLITALVIFPALSAMRLCRSFFGVTVFTAVFSVVCSLAGMLISIVCETPVGATVVGADAAFFVVCLAAGVILRHSNICNGV